MNASLPLVSVIVPNYNHQKYLDHRISSILSQNFDDIEIILLDDQSTDGSLSILKKFDNHEKVSHLVINEKNSGSPFKQWKKGFDLAKGKFIWIAESDDYSSPDFLNELLHFSENNPSAGVLYCQSWEVDSESNILGDRLEYTKSLNENRWKSNFVEKGEYFISEYMLKFNAIPNSSAVIFKRDLVTDAVFTSQLINMKYCGDWLFWTTLLKNTDIGYVSKKLNYFRTHQNVSRVKRNRDEMIRRLLEERVVLDSIIEFVDIKTRSNLYKRWFELHDIRSIMRSEFYKIRLIKNSKVYLALIFLIIKLKRRFNGNW